MLITGELLYAVLGTSITRKMHHYNTRQNSPKPLYVDNCKETCHQTLYFHLGQFLIWMLNVSDFSAVACIIITDEVCYYKMNQTSLKPSSVDN